MVDVFGMLCSGLMCFVKSGSILDVFCFEF